MQNYNTTTNADGFELSQADAILEGGSTVGPLRPGASTGAASAAAGGAEERWIGPMAVAPATASNSPIQPAELIDSASGHSQRSAPKKVLNVKCIEEPVRTSKNSMTTWKPAFEVERGLEGSLEEIIRRADLVRAPWNATPLPSGSARYGTTEELFARLQQAIAGQACLPEQTSALLTYWTISTWFPDGLSLAPALSIVAPEFEGDLVLRTLRNFCRCSMILTRADTTSLLRANWHTTPTLLFYDPNISKQMVATLGCSSARGYMINVGPGYKDFYGPKAIYLGEEVSVDRIPHCSLQVRLQPTAPAPATLHSLQPTRAVVDDLQNQLQRYRTKNLVRVYNSEFDASFLTSDTRAIANALGACVIDSPGLQSQLISLLTPVENQRQTERSISLEAVTLEATLNLAHAGKAQMLVHEIASEVNRIAQARGERLNHSAETIGHRLKKVGLSTRRLGKAGRGLAMDLATNARVHELAAVYCGVGLGQDDNNLHCPLCTQNK